MLDHADANTIFPVAAAIQTTGAASQINNAKPYVPVITLSVNDNIKFLENIKQGIKRTISWEKKATWNNNTTKEQ